MIIRNAVVDDAEQVFKLMNILDNENHYELYKREERNESVEAVEKRLTCIIDKKDLFLVLDNGEEIVGFISGIKTNRQTLRYAAYVIVGIEEKYHGLGYGTKLFKELNIWARENHIARLQATVICENKAAVHLYKKMGFEIEGTRKDSHIINGKYINEFYMSKIII